MKKIVNWTSVKIIKTTPAHQKTLLNMNMQATDWRKYLNAYIYEIINI